jgi:hypothetical protein
MTDSVVSIVYAVSAPTFPAGTVVDHIAVSIADAAVTPPVLVTQNVAPDTATVTFTNVAPGTYTATAQAQDASGSALGTAVTTTFTVTAPATISLSLPASISVA